MRQAICNTYTIEIQLGNCCYDRCKTYFPKIKLFSLCVNCLIFYPQADCFTKIMYDNSDHKKVFFLTYGHSNSLAGQYCTWVWINSNRISNKRLRSSKDLRQLSSSCLSSFDKSTVRSFFTESNGSYICVYMIIITK